MAETDPPILADAFDGLSEMILKTSPDRAGSELRLPPVAMERGDRFKLTVLLEGTGTAAENRVTADWRPRGGGRIAADDRRVRRSRRALVLAGATLALVGLLIVPTGTKKETVAVSCHAGSISIDGSTALEPAIEALTKAFETRCEGTKIEIGILDSGSGTALENLVTQGRAATNQEIQRTRLVMYDGDAPDPRDLARHTLGIGIFGVVAHVDSVPNGRLTSEQVRQLWDGEASTFGQVGCSGSKKVKLVSRSEKSGTRTAFEATFLGRRTAVAPKTSSDCNVLDSNPAGQVVHCVVDSTEAVLKVVNGYDGAIGYADVREAKAYPNVRVLLIDGHQPTEQDVASDAYPFWAVENLYTFGDPPPGTPLKDFLLYLATDEAQEILTGQFGYVPCSHFSNSPPARACASK